jgi:AhpD family alkylhydroperoxidase
MKAPMLSLRAVRGMIRALGRWPAAKGRGLDRALRERIILHVSAVNSCSVCTAAHTRTAARVGLAEDDIAAACALDLGPRDERTRAALRYAELRTRGVLREHADDVARFEAQFSDVERAAVDATVDLFTFNTRYNNTGERWLPGAQARRRRLGI